MFKNLVNIIAAPKEAFAALKDKPDILVPLLLVLLLAASVQYGYFQLADREFLNDQLIEQAQAFVSVPEDQLRQGIENTSTTQMSIQNSISIVIILPLIMLIYAGYLSLISKFTYDDIRFRQWFSLTVWTSIPTIFAALAGWVVILSSSNGMITLEQIKPLSVNNLLFHADDGLALLWSNTDLTQLWSLALCVIGYRQWTGKSMLKSCLVVAMPYILILAIALFFILT